MLVPLVMKSNHHGAKSQQSFSLLAGIHYEVHIMLS